MSAVQDLEELEEWHDSDDPWGYEGNPQDARRKAILLSELPNATIRTCSI